MIITKDDMLIQALKHLEWVLINRGYPRHLIANNIQKMMGLSQKDTLHKTKGPNNESQPLCTPIFSIAHGEHNKDIKHILLSHWHLVLKDPTLSDIFRSNPLVATKHNTKPKGHPSQCQNQIITNGYHT